MSDAIQRGCLTRERALQLLNEEIRKYIDEEYDGPNDKAGLKLELRHLGNSIGHSLRWFVQEMDCDLDDVRILMMLAWVDCDMEDFDHFYDVVEGEARGGGG